MAKPLQDGLAGRTLDTMKTAIAFAALAFVMACIIAAKVEALVSQMLPAGTIHP